MTAGDDEKHHALFWTFILHRTITIPIVIAITLSLVAVHQMNVFLARLSSHISLSTAVTLLLSKAKRSC